MSSLTIPTSLNFTHIFSPCTSFLQFHADVPVYLDGNSDSSDDERVGGGGGRRKPASGVGGSGTREQNKRSLRTVAVAAKHSSVLFGSPHQHKLGKSNSSASVRGIVKVQDGMAAMGVLPKLTQKQSAAGDSKTTLVLTSGGNGPDFRMTSTLIDVTRAQARADGSLPTFVKTKRAKTSPSRTGATDAMGRSASDTSLMLQVAKKKKKEEAFLSPKALRKKFALTQPLYSPITKPKTAPPAEGEAATGDTTFVAPMRNFGSTVQ